jgi:CHAT domain-containing protein
MSDQTKSSPEAWIGRLSLLPGERERRNLLRKHAGPGSTQLVELLYQEVVKLVRINLQRAERVAQAAGWLAEELDDDAARAHSLRAKGHVSYLTGNYRSALEQHEKARQIFHRLGQELNEARAIVSQLHPLAYLGRYSDAFELAGLARQIYEKSGDTLRQARLDNDIASIYFRQDRFSEAIALYQKSYETFEHAGTSQDIAVTLRNMAVSYIFLNQFEKALGAYQKARDFCESHELPLLVTEADYNIAYLYYLRGQYNKAIQLYQATRSLCRRSRDRYHMTLCDLDQAELYLELNLSAEGGALARRAYAGFRKLGMNYEGAKALTFQAIAVSHLGDPQKALASFDRARGLFIGERNRIWPTLIDLYKAVVLIDLNRNDEARSLCESSLIYFKSAAAPSKTAVCEILLARLDLMAKTPLEARKHCLSALQSLEETESPSVELQAHVMLGKALEGLGEYDAAYSAFQRAHKTLESLRSHLLNEESKIAFLKDKLSVYENLVCLSLARQGEEGYETVFNFVEQAKSRALADLIGFSVENLRPKASLDHELIQKMYELRERLSLAYRQAKREELSEEQNAPSRALKLRKESREYEEEYSRASSRIGTTDRDFASLVDARTISLEAIRSALPEDSTLIEYYEARGRFFVFILSGKQLQVVPLGRVDRVRGVFRLLQFQLSKFRLGKKYTQRLAPTLMAATESHLKGLYALLLAPVRNCLRGSRLVIVPHGFLHYLPFHCLLDGKRFLVDDFAISYSPSASVFYLCCMRGNKPQQESIVLGVPDRRAPLILKEADSVASVLPNARLFLGGKVTRDVFRDYAAKCRFLHIATHGLFRQDNPMFSSIRLGKSEMNLFDLYQLRLTSELVTLSGCGTGLNVVVGGDEILGLVRGLLYAGTEAVLATLWDVNDRSTAEFMKLFYREFLATSDKARAMQQAMRALRHQFPHPYFWAPFVLIGKAHPE